MDDRARLPAVPRRRRSTARWIIAGAVFATGIAWSADAPRPDLSGIGRAATPAEIQAWDIDVRGDFQGLPKGAGSVASGTEVWEAKCSSCHGDFAESNQVFTPLVGGTSKKDIESGRVFYLANPGYPHRTTLMKVSKLSSLWDYIRRAMPWNAPKSLSTDEVYGVLAYMLNLGDIVPADFTLSNENIAEVERRLPNRFGHVFYAPLWDVHGKGDVVNPACMRDCPVLGRITSSIPEAALGSHGNIADQVRPFGPARGTDTSGRSAGAEASTAAAAATSAAGNPAGLLKANGCTACHAVASKIVGPALQDVARKYAGRPDAVEYLTAKIRKGGQGVWGPIQMPEQTHLGAADAAAIAQWLSDGAR